jgi:ketosteroid isomerase-like protein
MGDTDREQLIEAFTAAWNAKDLDAVMDLMADDCAFRASVGPEPGRSFVGRDAVRHGFSLFLGPDVGPPPDTECAPTLVHRDFAVTRWTLRWPGVDGAPGIETRGCDVFEFDGDRISVKDTYRKVAEPPRPSG